MRATLEPGPERGMKQTRIREEGREKNRIVKNKRMTKKRENGKEDEREAKER